MWQLRKSDRSVLNYEKKSESASGPLAIRIRVLFFKKHQKLICSVSRRICSVVSLRNQEIAMFSICSLPARITESY